MNGKGGGVRGMEAENAHNQICPSVVSNNQKGCFSNSTVGEVGCVHGGEQGGKRNQPVEGKRNEASLQHDVTLSAFKSPKQKGAAAATNMDSRFNLPRKLMSPVVDLLGRPVPSTARPPLPHTSMHTRHTQTRRGEEERHQQKEQESNTNLVAIRDRSAARSS